MTGLNSIPELVARTIWLSRNRARFGRMRFEGVPRLFVDVSAIIRHDAQTGIQRVVRSVWSELSRRSGDDFVVVPVFATGRRGYAEAPLNFLERPSVPASASPVSLGPGDHFIGLDLSAHVLPKYRQQLKAWRAHGATIHMVVYDLLPLDRPDWFSPAMGSHFRRWFEVLLRDVDHAICISNQVAHELAMRIDRRGRDRRLRISRLAMGGDIAESLPSSGLCDEVGHMLAKMRFRPTILMVGTIEPRKGYDIALDAFDELWRSRSVDSPDLAIIGKAGWKTEALQHRIRNHPLLGRRLHWFEGVSDEGLCRSYDACRGLLVTSRAEGFGLPLIEAAMHRLPVLARDLPVFREQNLPNLTFFSEDSPEELAAGIMALAKAPRAAELSRRPCWRASVDILLRDLGLEVMETSSGPNVREAS